VDEMNDDWTLQERPPRRRSTVTRIGRPAALVAGGLVTGAVLAGTLSAGAANLTSVSNSATGYATGGSGGSNDTPVTGDELVKVTAAVKAKDSSVTVGSVRKDPDGSYDVFGTKAGNPVRYEVSADLKTITQGGGGRGGGRHGGRAGGGGSADTPVTGDELSKVTAALKAKDSSVTVSSVRKDPDGSYDVFGTKGGSQVMYEVSADLKTITQNTFGATRPGGPESAPSSSTT
jgi:hypothetical protein